MKVPLPHAHREDKETWHASAGVFQYSFHRKLAPAF